MDQRSTETEIDTKKVGTEFDKSFELLGRRAETVMTGNVYFPKYGVDESETQRGDMAIENLVKQLEGGLKCVFLISHEVQENDPFLTKLQEKLAEVAVNEDSLRLYKKKIESYSEARRLAMEKAVSEFSPKVVSLQEAEKDLVPFVDDLVKPLFEKGAGVVTMRRGDRLRSLPHFQRLGEGMQDSLIHGIQADAGIEVGSRPEDVLNGTRFIKNEPMETKYDRKVNPIDLFIHLGFAYDETSKAEIEEHKVYEYGIDKYSSAVYFPLVIAREIGIEVDEVEVPYVHDLDQKRLEDRDEGGKFREKRINQMKDIIAQHFDLVASIIVYKNEGKWPQVLWDALDKGTPLEIKHFSMSEWKIEDGKLINKV